MRQLLWTFFIILAYAKICEGRTAGEYLLWNPSEIRWEMIDGKPWLKVTANSSPCHLRFYYQNREEEFRTEFWRAYEQGEGRVKELSFGLWLDPDCLKWQYFYDEKPTQKWLLDIGLEIFSHPPFRQYKESFMQGELNLSFVSTGRNGHFSTQPVGVNSGQQGEILHQSQNAIVVPFPPLLQPVESSRKMKDLKEKAGGTKKWRFRFQVHPWPIEREAISEVNIKRKPGDHRLNDEQIFIERTFSIHYQNGQAKSLEKLSKNQGHCRLSFAQRYPEEESLPQIQTSKEMAMPINSVKIAKKEGFHEVGLFLVKPYRWWPLEQKVYDGVEQVTLQTIGCKTMGEQEVKVSDLYKHLNNESVQRIQILSDQPR